MARRKLDAELRRQKELGKLQHSYVIYPHATHSSSIPLPFGQELPRRPRANTTAQKENVPRMW
jgi:hypothetical protein